MGRNVLIVVPGTGTDTLLQVLPGTTILLYDDLPVRTEAHTTSTCSCRTIRRATETSPEPNSKKFKIDQIRCSKKND